MQTVVGPNHPSAPATYGPSRDMVGTFGLGTLRREDPNMLQSRKQVAVSLAGFTQPKWKQGRAVENKGGVLPASRALDVIARSGNQTNLAAIGLAADTSAQVGEGSPAPITGLTSFISGMNPLAKAGLLVLIGMGLYNTLKK